MKVLLLQPTYYQDAGRTDVYNIVPPLGLGYLANIARREGHEARIFDIMGRDAELPRVMAEFPPDVIGITGMTTNYPEMVSLCRRLRGELGFRGTLVGGGAHVTLEPRRSIEQADFDVIVLGEGDDSFPRLLAALEARGDLSGIQGLHLKNGGDTGKPEKLVDLNTLVDPYYEGLEFDRYVTNSVFVECARGCPYTCVYCSSKHLYGRSLRWMEPAKVIHNIEILGRDFGFKEFSPLADTFVADKRWLERFCTELKERDLGMRYHCNGRINLMTDDVFRWLKESGCYLISYGVESAVGHVLKNIHKGYKVEQLEETIRRTRENGFQCHLWFMMSLPGETEEDIETTIQFARRMKRLYQCSSEFQITRVYPGTPLAEKVSLVNDDWTAVREPTLPYPNVPAYYELDPQVVYRKWRESCEEIRDTTIWENVKMIPEMYRTSRDKRLFFFQVAKRGVRKVKNVILKRVR